MNLIGNLIFFVLGGFVIFLGYVLLAVLFALTIVGLPVASQHMKLVPLALLPFGHRVRETATPRH